jgi:hypothetical protein
MLSAADVAEAGVVSSPHTEAAAGDGTAAGSALPKGAIAVACDVRGSSACHL